MGVFKRGWCHLRGGAGLLSFSWGGLPKSHGGQSMEQISKNSKKNERGCKRGSKKKRYREKQSTTRVFIGPKYSPLRRGEDTFAAAKSVYTAA